MDELECAVVAANIASDFLVQISTTTIGPNDIIIFRIPTTFTQQDVDILVEVLGGGFPQLIGKVLILPNSISMEVLGHKNYTINENSEES